MLDGCAMVRFPPIDKVPILELRRKLRGAYEAITRALLRKYKVEIREIYLETMKRLLNPPMPVVANTDGDLWPGAGARHLGTDVQSVEEAMQRRGRKPDREASGREHEQLMAVPEVRARIEEMLRAHYANWATEKLPALGGRTPRQAVKDPEGREMVEALLVQMERDVAVQAPWMSESPAASLRAKLGL